MINETLRPVSTLSHGVIVRQLVYLLCVCITNQISCKQLIKYSAETARFINNQIQNYSSSENQYYIETKPTFAENSGLAVIQQNTDYIVSCLHCISTYIASPFTMYPPHLQFQAMQNFNFPQHRNYILSIIYQNT